MIELVFLACKLIALLFAMLSTYKKLIFYTLRSLYSYFLPVLSHLIIPFTISFKNAEILLKILFSGTFEWQWTAPTITRAVYGKNMSIPFL